MKIYDISMDIHHDMPVYKDKEEKRPVVRVVQDFSTGSSYESNICMDMHTGTHMDAPLHMIRNGGTVGGISLEKVITRCKVLDMSDIEESISEKDLAGKNVDEGDFILFKTKNSYIEGFDYNFIFLNKSGAEHLCKKRISGVGIDALGIERSQPAHETHTLLLGSGILILEGLRLKDIEEGEYLLFAAPLKISQAEAAPVRAVLVGGLG